MILLFKKIIYFYMIYIQNLLNTEFKYLSNNEFKNLSNTESHNLKLLITLIVQFNLNFNLI